MKNHTINGRHLFPNLHPVRFFRKRPAKSTATTLTRRGLQIHGGHHQRKKPKTYYRQWCVRPCTRFFGHQTHHEYLGTGARHQKQLVQIHQRAKIYSYPIFLARRIWSIFLCPITDKKTFINTF